MRTVASSPLFPPIVTSEPLLLPSKETEFYNDVTKVRSQSSSGALHSNDTSLQSIVDIFWNVDGLTAENGLHFCSRCKERTQASISSISSVEWKLHESKDLYCLPTALHSISRKVHDKELTNEY